MKITLEEAPRLVARLHDPGARTGELLAGVGARDSEAQDLGELAEPPLGVCGQPLEASVAHGERTPQPVREDDRRGGDRAVAERPHGDRQLSRHALVVVDPSRPTRPEQAGEGPVVLHRDRRAVREAPEIGALPPPDDRRGLRIVKAQDRRGVGSEDAGSLLGHRAKDAVRLRLSCDESGDAPQRLLLLHARMKLLLRPAALGDVLADARRADPPRTTVLFQEMRRH